MTASLTITAPLLQVTDLVRHYPMPRESLFGPVQTVKALNGVSFSVKTGRSLGIVGESGSGKSTIARIVMALDKPTSGSVQMLGRDLHKISTAELRTARRDFQMVFQDPYGSLDPRQTVARIVAEPLEALAGSSRAEQRERASESLSAVGLRTTDLDKYPHEFSGGQRQRIGIARALAVEPSFLVADEPVSALDVSVQAQVLNLLSDLQRERGLSYLFIAHDLAVVRQIAHRIAVMYLGRIVETGPSEALLADPRHPYTVALLSAVPEPDPSLRRQRIVLPGDPPSPTNPPPGCPFHTRCFHPARSERCRTEVPLLRPVAASLVACHYAETTPAAGPLNE